MPGDKARSKRIRKIALSVVLPKNDVERVHCHLMEMFVTGLLNKDIVVTRETLLDTLTEYRSGLIEAAKKRQSKAGRLLHLPVTISQEDTLNFLEERLQHPADPFSGWINPETAAKTLALVIVDDGQSDPVWGEMARDLIEALIIYWLANRTEAMSQDGLLELLSTDLSPTLSLVGERGKRFLDMQDRTPTMFTSVVIQARHDLQTFQLDKL